MDWKEIVEIAGYNANTLGDILNVLIKLNKTAKQNTGTRKGILLFQIQDPNYEMEVMMASA